MSVVWMVILDILALGSAAYALRHSRSNNTSRSENIGCLVMHLCFYSGIAAVCFSVYYIRDYILRPKSPHFAVFHPALLVLSFVVAIVIVGLYLWLVMSLWVADHRLWKNNPREAEKKLREWDDSPHNPQNFM